MLKDPSQIRAARGLLDWSQKDLATRAGVSKTTIINIEKGIAPLEGLRGDTFHKIQNAFTMEGVEFTENQGVRIAPQGIREYHGRQGFVEFMNDVADTTAKMGGEICVSNVDEREFGIWGGDDLEIYKQKMASLDNYNFKVLLKHVDDYFPASNYIEYRWADENTFDKVPFYVYGDRFAILIFDKNNVSVYVLRNQRIADAYRKQFNISWEDASIPVISGRKEND